MRYSNNMPVLPNKEKSFWREAYTVPLYPELLDDLEVDVVIIGAGITGLTSAYLLKQSGLSVAVLEKDTVGGGTTGRTTGKVTSQHGLVYADLIKQVGEEAARMYSEANQAAIEQIDAIITKESIDCHWTREDNYVFTADPRKAARFEQEAEAADRLGLPVRLKTDIPLPLEVKAAVTFAGQGKIHAQKYLQGMAAAINDEDNYIFEHSNVIGVRDGDPCRVTTRKAAITAKHVIVATNVPTFPLLARGGYCILEYPTESYAIAARTDASLKGMYISPDKGHHSILPVEIDGDQYVLIVGEGGNLPGFRLGKEPRHQRLADYAAKWFNVSRVTHRWSDRDYLAYDDIPLIGKLYPWSKHLYVGTAYKKWGLSGGTVAGMILCDSICGRENVWAAVFDSRRIGPVLSIPRAIARYVGRGH